MWPIRIAGRRVLARTKSETGGGITCTTLSKFILILVYPHTRIPPHTLASRIPRQLINPPRDLRNTSHLLTPTWRRAHSVYAIPFFPPKPKNVSSLPARRGTRLAAPNVALTPHGARTSSMARTLATAGLGAAVSTAGGNHSILSVAPYLVLVFFPSRTRDGLFWNDRCAVTLSLLSRSVFLIDVG